ncbi:J domain-containing protein [Plasmodiophora brassicae]
MASSSKLAFLTGVVVLAGVMGLPPVKKTMVLAHGRPVKASRLALVGWAGFGAVAGFGLRAGLCNEGLIQQGFYRLEVITHLCARHALRKEIFLSSAPIFDAGYLVYNRLKAMTRSRIVGFLVGYATTEVGFKLQTRLLPAKYCFEKQVLAFRQAPTLETLSDTIESFGAASGHYDWISLLESHGQMHVFLNKFGCDPALTGFDWRADLASCKTLAEGKYGSAELTATGRDLYALFLRNMNVLIGQQIPVDECNTLEALGEIAKIHNDVVDAWISHLQNRGEVHKFLNLFNTKSPGAPKLTGRDTRAQFRAYTKQVHLYYHPDRRMPVSDVEADLYKKFRVVCQQSEPAA